MAPAPCKAEDCTESVGRIVSIQGEIHVRRLNQVNWILISLDDSICPGDMLRAGSNARAAVTLLNESVLRINQNTTLSFPKQKAEQPFLLKILDGVLYIFSHRPRGLQVITPFVNGAVEGTEFLVQVDSTKASISVFKGLVAAFNDHGRMEIASGQTVVAAKGSAPKQQTVVRPRDAVQWTLYYPEIIEPTPGLADKNSTSSLIRKAADHLAVGQINEAQHNIETVLAKEPGNSDALALQAIMKLVQNQKDEAFALATKAVEISPQSPAANMALSYALQARFDIEGALATLQEAAILNPINALLKARLSELYLSVGELDKALGTAKEAAALKPNLGRTQSVLGFAYLTKIQIDQAKAAFNQAISLGQTSPLARLGLGLAKIRSGDLEGGRGEIEIAAALNPGNSLIRSYLGKSFYEEKRDRRAQEQYSLAKQLDPMDPTPWLYDAIRKQTVNRPVEALHDLQKSIELNDNRAVFRSRLLLDEDLAVRSSSLGRIYNDLGFQQRGLVEGWNSVNIDPANFSAHRFLADSYAVLPRHEIARVSELLQAQLLQPINITPIQPVLAESNLFLISAQGSAAAGYNTFNPLFNRNQTTLQASGILAENNTWGGEGVVSGIYNRLSLSAGYSRFQSDGWHDNTDQDDDFINFFGQYEISQKTSIQAEYRYRNSERGVISQLFFEDNISPNLRFIDKVNQGRLGFHHAFSSGSDLIGNFQFADADRPSRDFDETWTRFDIETEEESYGGELSYLFGSHHFNIIAGGGYYNVKKEDEVFLDYLGEPYFNEILDRSVDHSNLYIYSHIKPGDKLTITVGASGDLFDPEDETQLVKRDQVNPKLGVSWIPFTGTTLRGAAFRVLKRTLIADQTIEPTHVSGFNQFFDESNGADYWVYGGAIDQQFTQTMYGGLEFTRRDLTIPVFFTDTGTEEFNWEEDLVRAYLFCVPHDLLSLSAEYVFEGLDRDEEYSNGVKEADTHRVPLGINFFHPTGLSATLKGTFVNQSGIFKNEKVGAFLDGDDDFFLLDVAIRYRLPKRYGLISIGVNNLTDESFQYFNSDEDNMLFQPNRVFFCKITLALP